MPWGAQLAKIGCNLPAAKWLAGGETGFLLEMFCQVAHPRIRKRAATSTITSHSIQKPAAQRWRLVAILDYAERTTRRQAVTPWMSALHLLGLWINGSLMGTWNS